MRGESIVILSSDDWGWKTSKYQLSKRFARHNRVLFVSSIGFRAPTASRGDLLRMIRKLWQTISGPRQVDDNLWVLTPFVLPFPGISWLRRFNRALLSFQYALALKKLRLASPVLFVFSPNWGDHIDSLSHRKLVYYCVDEHSGFANVSVARFTALDQMLTRRADVVLCSARALFLVKQRMNGNTHYVPHGVDWNLFARAVGDPSLDAAKELSAFGGPILLFFGHVSYDWVDVDLIRYLAGRRPDWRIVLIGRVAIDLGEFSACPNVHLLGEREYEALPAYCKGADIGLIPFVKSRLTNACNPLKLYEYLAAGLPVVATDIPELRQFGSVIGIARSHEEFFQECLAALEVERTEHARRSSAAMRHHDWDARVQQILALVA